MRSLPVGSRAAGFTGALLMVVLGAWLAAAQSRPLRLFSTPWPPFTNEVGQPRFALDLVEAALGRFNQASTTTIVPPGQFTATLLGGDFDGSGAAWRDAEREKVLLYSDPYLENRLVLVGRKGSDVSATALAGLAGKRVALVDGYSYGPEVENSGPTFVRASSEEDCLAKLLAGQVEYALMDDLVVQYITVNHAREAETKLQLGARPLVKRPLYLVLRRTYPDAQSIIDRFNAQLRGMIADRTYHRLLHVDWIQADVDGDGLFEYIPENDTKRVTEPTRAYSIFSEDPPKSSTTPVAESTQPRFYMGGNIYRDWASVPANYKAAGNMPPPPSRATASIFRFAW
jgi:polar amino acid transport system substrate-binding protein